MCGIITVFSSHQDVHAKSKSALEVLDHRGPDNTGYLKIGDNLSFGHKRLSIVDLSPKANQPFINKATGNVLIYNGEIYNFQELKELLPNVHFYSSSDTEVLLYLIENLGIETALQKCNGMFAISFWNESKHELTLARDRFGKKPMFYYLESNSLFVASEAKALFEMGVEPEVEHKAVVNYLNEITIGKNESSFFKGIGQLKSGTFETYKMIDNKVVCLNRKQYWSFPRKNKSISYEAATEEFKALLVNSVNIRLSEEVPYATMLSGGLDSSSVTACASRFNPNIDITSISAIYPGDEKDESSFAKELVNENSNIKPIWIDDIDFNKSMDVIHQVVWNMECPIADGSLISQNILMNKISEQGIKVILSGMGGDEVLAGYPSLFFHVKESMDYLKAKSFKLNARSLVHLLPDLVKNRLYIKKHKNNRLILNDNYMNLMWPRFNKYGHEDKLNDYLIQGIEHWTLPNLVWYEDRNSMAWSVESRCPFLDYRIVEFLLSIPAEYKINREFTKRILRDAMIGIVPNSILKRTDKQGFHAPIDKWTDSIDFKFLNDKEFKEEFNYINWSEIEGSAFRTKWRIFTLYIWYKTFISK